MRVQPHLPRSPFTATLIAACGAALCACSAANRPAPPEPRIRMSVSSERTALSEHLDRHRDRDQAEARDARPPLGVDEEEACGDEEQAYGGPGIPVQPALKPGDERHDARDRYERDD